MLPFAAAWIGVALWLGREYAQRDAATIQNA